jgi:fluoride exporter
MILVIVALGGALGSMFRYAVMSKIGALWGSNFPYSTLIVNVSGSCLMGILIGLLAKSTFATTEIRAFLAVGVLGGYTTFSTFSLDVLTLWERGEVKQAVIYIALSLVLSIGGIVAGLWGTRLLG